MARPLLTRSLTLLAGLLAASPAWAQTGRCVVTCEVPGQGTVEFSHENEVTQEACTELLLYLHTMNLGRGNCRMSFTPSRENATPESLLQRLLDDLRQLTLVPSLFPALPGPATGGADLPRFASSAWTPPMVLAPVAPPPVVLTP